MFTGPWELERPIGIAIIAFILLIFVLEWTTRKKEYALQIHQKFAGNQIWKLLAIDYLVIALIILYGNFESSQFIYFQF